MRPNCHLPEHQPDRDPIEIGTISERGIVADFRAEVKRLSLGEAENSETAQHDEHEQIPVPIPAIEQSRNGSLSFGEGEEQNKMRESLSVSPSAINALTTPLTTVEDYVNRVLGPRKPFGRAYVMELVGRTFPIWGVILILILTRIPQFCIKPYLTLKEPYFEIYLNSYGVFRLSASLVLQLNNILTYPNLNWKYELLYTPFVVPFVIVSVATMGIYRKDMGDIKPMDVFGTVANRLVDPFIALLGALSLVQLLIKSQTEAPSYILGTILAAWFKQGFVVISPLLGALGSFFSGSTTVSNLAFGSIQARLFASMVAGRMMLGSPTLRATMVLSRLRWLLCASL